MLSCERMLTAINCQMHNFLNKIMQVVAPGLLCRMVRVFIYLFFFANVHFSHSKSQISKSPLFLCTSLNILFSLPPAAVCESLSLTNGMVVIEGDTTFIMAGRVATHSCSNNYRLVGNMERMCQVDGFWSGSEPICRGK